VGLSTRMHDLAMIRRIICGVAVFALLPVLAGCGRGHAILEAAEKGDTKTVERLLKKDPGLVNARRFGPGWSPLQLAAGRGHAEIVALLLEAGAPMEDGAIRDAAVGGHIKIIEMFLAKGVDINGPPDLMEGAVTGGSTAMVQWLLAHGASVQRKPGSMGPLQNAAFRGHKAVAEILLAHGARADAKDEDGRTPLLSAAFGGNTDIAELLIQHGAKVNDATTKGVTPLMRAADSHAVGTVKLLLERGADVNARDDDQDTALTYAMRRRLSDTAEERAEAVAREVRQEGLRARVVSSTADGVRIFRDHSDAVRNFIPNRMGARQNCEMKVRRLCGHGLIDVPRNPRSGR